MAKAGSNSKCCPRFHLIFSNSLFECKLYLKSLGLSMNKQTNCSLITEFQASISSPVSNFILGSILAPSYSLILLFGVHLIATALSSLHSFCIGFINDSSSLSNPIILRLWYFVVGRRHLDNTFHFSPVYFLLCVISQCLSRSFGEIHCNVTTFQIASRFRRREIILDLKTKMFNDDS